MKMRSPRSLIATAAAMAFGGAAQAAQSPQIPLNAGSIPQWVNQLPLLSLPGAAGIPTDKDTIPALVDDGSQIDLSMCEFQSSILPTGTPLAAGANGKTWTWGYTWTNTGQACNGRDVYLGPVVVATKDLPTEINFINNLGTVNTGNATDTKVTFYKYSIDQTLHWADPLGTSPASPTPTGKAEGNLCAQTGGIPYGACADNYAGPIGAVPHLHGGEVPPVLDGGPDAWYTSVGAVKGHAYYTSTAPGALTADNAAIYRYPNGQSGAPIWFHDHLLGATRLNVYAGLAGGYLITEAGTLPPNLPTPEQIIPVVLQDRMFDTSGELFFPGDSAGGVLWSVNPEHPYWVPEFVGDTIVVNGKAWPNLNVEAKRYRFWFVNGSNARTYEMFLTNPVTKVNGPPMWVISTDGGYLDTAVKVDPNAPKGQPQRLIMMPGERYEAIIDFGGLPAGTKLQLRNIAKTPYPAGTSPNGSTTGRLVQFTVVAGAPTTDTSYNPATTPKVRQAGYEMVRLADPTKGALAPGVTVNVTRQLTLNEVLAPPSTVTDPVTGVLTTYPGGPMEILVNNTKWDGGVASPGTCLRGDFTPLLLNGVTTCYSELPKEGDTEVWEIVNTTADAHPMHTHLVDFQLVNRQKFNTNNYAKAYGAAFPGGAYAPAYGPPLDYNSGNPRALGGNPDITPYLQGPALPPDPQEAGWKDTVMVPPGMVTRIVMRWSPNATPLGATGQAAAFPFNPNAGGHGYVWHCHIIDHEDNEMMRPDIVQPLSGVTRSYVDGVDY